MRNWKDDSKAIAHLLQEESKWDFNPPAASHMGGIWEKEIRTVRKGAECHPQGTDRR